MNTHLGRSAYHALQTSVTKRFSNRWQGSATYTLSGLWNADTKPFSGLEQVTFDTVKDLGGEWGLSADDQRHRMVLNGIWQVGKGFQVSALHFFAAGIRARAHLRRRSCAALARTSASVCVRTGRSFRVTICIAPPQNRTDIRLQQRIPLGGRVSIDGIAEVFNAFNRPNWGIGTQESTVDSVPAAHVGAGSHGAVRLQTDVLGRHLPTSNAQLPRAASTLESWTLGGWELGVSAYRIPGLFPYPQMSPEVPSWP